MSVISTQRPHFFEGQYLGADDMTTALEYGRTYTRRHALGGHTWGIAMGLGLEESLSPAGVVEVYLLPGFAWDGYGRQLTVLGPKKLSPGMFEGHPTGLVEVWLAYRETAASAVRRGFEVCDAADTFSRVRESYLVVAGQRPNLRDRHEGVAVGSETLADPREALEVFESEAGLLCDASVPHQQFPADEDEPLWLVPLGKVQWHAGAGGTVGHFGERSDDGKRQSRAFRRYAGVVTEGIQAADGLIRLRKRMTPRPATAPAPTNDQICVATRLALSDFADGVIDDLVWIEGNLRVLGNARLWGTKLELRNFGGGDDGVPLYLRRGPAPGLDDGRDIEIMLGLEADDPAQKNRLVIGTIEVDPVSGDEAIVPKTVITDDARVGVGSEDPNAYHDDADDVVIATDANTGLTISASATGFGSLFFASGTTPNASHRGRIRYENEADRMSFGTATNDFLYLNAQAMVGIGTPEPEQYSVLADDLVIYNEGSGGLTIATSEQGRGSIHFADGTLVDQVARGFITYIHTLDQLNFGTSDSPQMAIASNGYVGIGITAPEVRLHVVAGNPIGLDDDQAFVVIGHSDDPNLALSDDSIQARQGGAAAALRLQPKGGPITIHEDNAPSQRVVVTSAGRIGMGIDVPVRPLHIHGANPDIVLDTTGSPAELRYYENGVQQASVYWDPADDQLRLRAGGSDAVAIAGPNVGIGNTAPANTLHVSGDVNASAQLLSSHVAQIENTNTGSNADVLALRVAAADAGNSNNFITFFDASGAVGAIEGGIFGVNLTSGSADYAEWLPRLDPDELLEPGDVVAIVGGKVTRNTDDAEQLLAITDRPIVLANRPRGDTAGYAPVAMVGQLPLKVVGAVAVGDYLLASGESDGTAVAVAPDALAPEDLVRVVGRAWEGSRAKGIKRVLTAISMQSAALTALIHHVVSAQKRPARKKTRRKTA